MTGAAAEDAAIEGAAAAAAAAAGAWFQTTSMGPLPFFPCFSV